MPKEKILIALNDEEEALALASNLKGLGYIVVGQAEQCEIALQMVEELIPDLVFMDVDLHGQTNGLDAGKQIQKNFDIPVILITSKTDPVRVEAAMQARASGLMIKPIHAHDLKPSLNMAFYHHRISRNLRENEERYLLAIRASKDGVWDWNLKTNKVYYSERWKEMIGYAHHEIGTHINEWYKRIHPENRKQLQEKLANHIRGSTPYFECEYQIQRSDGGYLWMLCRGLAVRDSKGIVSRIAGVQSDISARKLAEESLAHSAVHDPLTGLPNRLLFLDRLQNRLDRTKRNPDDQFAVMFIDLDRFKVVNDSLGHAFGDQLLVTTGWRLQHCLRSEDSVSRLSGDEFAVLLDSVHSIDDARFVAERIRAQLVTTTLLGVVERSPTASIGIVMFDKKYTAAEDLLRDADIAMYHAKRSGGNQYRLFVDSMYTSAVEAILLEGELKHAVERQEWLVYYQPIISISSRKPVGAEALVRWRHPQRGILSPQEFIQAAEATGLIVPLGEFVLRTACEQAKEWRNSGYPDFWVSVNISARQFRDKDLVEMIDRILTETGLACDGLRLEITESVAVQNREYTIQILHELNAMGVYTSLDDFGTGYSSLSYLKQFPLKVLKVDQSFVQDIESSQKTQALIKAIIGMARSLDLEVIGEGVEKMEQLDFLRVQSCDQVQGYLLSRPLPAGEITRMLE
jgi:diguanylate cyclase (GGDEF)-like protein/PAS domain S-box-containing protein